MTAFYLPVPELGVTGAAGAAFSQDAGSGALGGGPVRFRLVRRVARAEGGAARFGPPEPAQDIRDSEWPAARERIVARRSGFCGVLRDGPVLMGIVNATPDSFSDGGLYADAESAARRGERLAAEGAAIVDFGGESTRPGAAEVPVEEEIRRVVPAIERFRDLCPEVPVSIDTRKAKVARSALAAGARIVNDVSGLTRDPRMAEVVAEAGACVCVMHAQGTPERMQDAPRYRSALLDVYEWLERRVEAILRRGVPRERIAVDPGIGFGKDLGHNLELLSGLSAFHGLGCALLVGASRKRFIGSFPGGGSANCRLPGSLAAALQASASGAHVVRVHDVGETAQALGLWRAFHRNGAA